MTKVSEEKYHAYMVELMSAAITGIMSSAKIYDRDIKAWKLDDDAFTQPVAEEAFYLAEECLDRLGVTYSHDD